MTTIFQDGHQMNFQLPIYSVLDAVLCQDISCFTCRVFILIFLESKMATIFLRWLPNVLLHKLNYVTCVIIVLNNIFSDDALVFPNFENQDKGIFLRWQSNLPLNTILSHKYGSPQ